jgi:sulfur carrier protein ThiS
VKVHLWGELGFYGPGKRSRFEVSLDRPMALEEALRVIGVPAADIAVLGVNGVVVHLGAEPDLTVTDADRIDCFPATSGG